MIAEYAPALSLALLVAFCWAVFEIMDRAKRVDNAVIAAVILTVVYSDLGHWLHEAAR